MNSRLLVGIALFATLLPGQNEERADPHSEEAAIKERMERGMKPRAEEEYLTPEQRLERNIVTGASSHCRFQASVTPPRLLPGQTGVLRIVASVYGDAVIPAPAPLEVLTSGVQGAVTLGAYAIRPAGIGQLAKGYLGRPVYDNYVVIEMPVTMGNDAEIGKKYPVKVDMKFDLYSGTNATVIGRYLDHAAAEIEAGASPVPLPSTPMTATNGAAEVAASSAASAVRGNETAPPVVGSAPVRGEASVPATPVAPAPDVEGGSLPLSPASEEAGLPPFLWIGSGALLLVVVLMLLRRKQTG